MKNLIVTAAVLAAAVGLPARAQEVVGQKEFMTACAVCHGESGLGDGQFSALMSVPVPDLTTLSAQNEGDFPFLKVFKAIDGRADVAAHGGPMPLWGDRYLADAEEEFGAFGAEVVTRGRILSLVNYLETLQQ